MSIYVVLSKILEFTRALAFAMALVVAVVVCLAVENEYKYALQAKLHRSRQSILPISHHLKKKPLRYWSMIKSKNMSLIQQQALANCEPVAQELEFKLCPAVLSYEDVYSGLSSFSFGTYPGYEFDEGFSEFFPYSLSPCKVLCFGIWGSLSVWPVCLVIWLIGKWARFLRQMSIKLFYPN